MSSIVDCGQDGVCVTAPGCNRHWEERCRELCGERDGWRARAEAAETTLADMHDVLKSAVREREELRAALEAFEAP